MTLPQPASHAASTELEIAAALRCSIPDGDRIAAVRPATSGFSNRTFVIQGLDLVLRVAALGEPLLAAFHVHDVPAQYRIMEELAHTNAAPPVPRPVLLHPGTDVLGLPFYLMARVDCDPWDDFGRPDWLNSAHPLLRTTVSESLVRNYVCLHGLAPLASLGPPRSARDELERWQAPVRGLAGDALAETFEILQANVPPEQPPAPCHGDAKPANLLWKGGRIVAMVDYEMAFNGDPRWDVAALVQGMRSADGRQPLAVHDETGFWGEQRIVTEWQKRSGRSIDRLDWFKAADRARYAALLVHGQRLFDTGQTKDAAPGTFGPIATRLSEVALASAQRDLASLSCADCHK